MVGMAVETMVWSRLESSMPAMSAEKMIQMRRWVSSSGPAAALGLTWCSSASFGGYGVGKFEGLGEELSWRTGDVRASATRRRGGLLPS